MFTQDHNLASPAKRYRSMFAAALLIGGGVMNGADAQASTAT